MLISASGSASSADQVPPTARRITSPAYAPSAKSRAPRLVCKRATTAGLAIALLVEEAIDLPKACRREVGAITGAREGRSDPLSHAARILGHGGHGLTFAPGPCSGGPSALGIPCAHEARIIGAAYLASDAWVRGEPGSFRTTLRSTFATNGGRR